MEWGRQIKQGNNRAKTREKSNNDIQQQTTRMQSILSTPSPSLTASFYLYEGNVLWKPLFDILQPLQWLSEGGEVRHQRSQAAVRHKAGENFPRWAMQQVELDV